MSLGGGNFRTVVDLPEAVTAWSWSRQESVKEVIPGQPVMLAAVVGSKSGSLRGPGILFDKHHDTQEALTHYDVAYILKVTFQEDLEEEATS